MNRKWLTGIGIALVAVASLAVVGGLAFRAGQRHDGVSNVVLEDGMRDVVLDDGVREVVGNGWRHGGLSGLGGFGGPGFGFLFFPLLIVGLVLLFNSRRDRRGGPWRDDQQLQDWHRRAHADAAAVAVAPTPPPAPPPAAPPAPAAPVEPAPPQPTDVQPDPPSGGA